MLWHNCFLPQKKKKKKKKKKITSQLLPHRKNVKNASDVITSCIGQHNGHWVSHDRPQLLTSAVGLCTGSISKKLGSMS